MSKVGVAFDDVVSLTTGATLLSKDDKLSFGSKSEITYITELAGYTVVDGSPQSAGQLELYDHAVGTVSTINVKRLNVIHVDTLTYIQPKTAIRVEKDSSNFIEGFVETIPNPYASEYTYTFTTIARSGTIDAGSSVSIKTNVQEPNQPLFRSRLPITSTGNLVINLLKGRVVEFPSGLTGSVTMPSYADISNDDLFVLNLEDVEQDISYITQIPNSEFWGGESTYSLKAHHRYIFWAHTDLPSTPISPTNKLIIEPIIVSNMRSVSNSGPKLKLNGSDVIDNAEEIDVISDSCKITESGFTSTLSFSHGTKYIRNGNASPSRSGSSAILSADANGIMMVSPTSTDKVNYWLNGDTQSGSIGEYVQEGLIENINLIKINPTVNRSKKFTVGDTLAWNDNGYFVSDLTQGSNCGTVVRSEYILQLDTTFNSLILAGNFEPSSAAHFAAMKNKTFEVPTGSGVVREFILAANATGIEVGDKFAIVVPQNGGVDLIVNNGTGVTLKAMNDSVIPSYTFPSPTSGDHGVVLEYEGSDVWKIVNIDDDILETDVVASITRYMINR